MDEKRKVRFSFLFQIFYNLFSSLCIQYITCPLAKEMFEYIDNSILSLE